MPLGFARLDGSRQVDRAAVEQQLFRQGRLAGVGMTDDAECPAPLYFVFLPLSQYLKMSFAY